MAARKKVLRIHADRNDSLRNGITLHATSDQAREAMFKDAHLLEAALVTDRIVVSLDREARGLFGRTSLN